MTVSDFPSKMQPLYFSHAHACVHIQRSGMPHNEPHWQWNANDLRVNLSVYLQSSRAGSMEMSFQISKKRPAMDIAIMYRSTTSSGS